MEKILVLLLVTLAVAYAVPDPRGIIINLVRLALDLWVPPGAAQGWEVRRLLPLPVPCPRLLPRGPREADQLGTCSAQWFSLAEGVCKLEPSAQSPGV